MAYYFAVETEENSFYAINVKRCRDYRNSLSYYDIPLACTLKEINNITTTFKDEDELKEMLVKVYSLKEEDFEKPLRIFYIEGLERRLVNANVLYEDSRDYLEEPTKVIEYIKHLAIEKDCLFFRQLSEIYQDDSIFKSLICKIASLLEGKLINENEVTNIEMFVEEVVKFLIYETEINDLGLITCKSTINYEKLHILVSFISDYKLLLEKDKTSQKRKIKENTSN